MLPDNKKLPAEETQARSYGRKQVASTGRRYAVCTCRGDVGKRPLQDTGCPARVTYVLHELEEVPFHELEHEEELVVFSDDFLQLDDVRVAELLQGLHLPELHALLPSGVTQDTTHRHGRDNANGKGGETRDNRPAAKGKGE